MKRFPKKTEAQVAAERAFVEKAMALIRGELYGEISEGAWAREWPDLLLAVSEPAAYLHARGRMLPGGRYLAMLREVVAGIVVHGKPRGRSLPMYLRRCVQEHMRVRGEGYLEEAKGLDGRGVSKAGTVAGAVVRGLRVVAGDPAGERLTEALVAARGLIEAGRRGR